MKSIFIWKSSHPLPSTTTGTITMYMGPDWALDEMPTETISYEMVDYTTCEEFMIYTIQPRPSNWVGYRFLEKKTVPYLKQMEDDDGIYERIGEWCRYRYKKEEIRTREEMKKSCDRIRRAIVEKSI